MKNKKTAPKKLPKPLRQFLIISLILAFGILASAFSLFLYPQPLFRWSVRQDQLSLYSDRPFSPSDGERILEQVQRKLAASPLYSTQAQYAIFICNTRWRRALCFIGDLHAGGVVYYPLSTNVFLSGANIEKNLLISPSGLPDALGRRLDHFIAHEIAHDLTGQAIGWQRYRHLPVWIREGYAEYIGSQGVFNYSQSEQAYKQGASEMNTPPQIPYRRYNLLIAYLLDKQKWSPSRLFEAAPSQNDVELMLKKHIQDKSR